MLKIEDDVNISKEEANKKVLCPETSHEERMELIREGLVDMETIETLFRKNLLYYDDVYQLIDDGIVDGIEMVKAIKNVSLKERGENSKIRLVECEEEPEKELLEVSLNKKFLGNTRRIRESHEGLIINQIAKETLFSLLGAVRPTKISTSEDSAFHGYNFYIIPIKKGEISAESIAIADAEEKTYCCKYGDLMVLDNYIAENEEIKEIKNTGYIVKNSITTEGRSSWGMDFLYAVIKTMASSDMEYPEGKEEERSRDAIKILHRKYTSDQIMRILNYIKKLARCVDAVSTDDKEPEL